MRTSKDTFKNFQRPSRGLKDSGKHDALWFEIINPLYLCAIILVAVFVVFSPCLKNDFINWDDDVLIVNNYLIRNFSVENIGQIFRKPHLATYIPLTLLSFMLEYHVWGSNAFVFHLNNHILHALNALLVFALLRLLLKRNGAAFGGALIFAIHPLRVESVAWATERKDVLYAFFFLSASWVYLKYKTDRIWRYYFLSLALFIMALLSKGTAVFLPVVLILFDYLEGRLSNKKDWADKIPYLFLSILFGLFAFYLTSSDLSQSKASFGLGRRLNIFPAAFMSYWFHFIFPYRITSYYNLPPSNAAIVMGYVGFLLLIIAVLKILPFMRRFRWLTFGLAFFSIQILPFTHLVSWSSRTMIGDRFTYIPSIGLSLIAGMGIAELISRSRNNKHKFAKYLLLVTMLVIISWAIFTHQRCKVWRNSEIFWSDVIRKDTHNAVAFSNRGNYYASIGNIASAIADYSRAIAIRADNDEAYVSRGNAFIMMNNTDKAMEDFLKAVTLNPSNFKAHIGLGAIHAREKKYSEAENNFSQAIRIAPKESAGYVNRGNVRASQGNYQDALEDYQTALQYDPWNYQAYDNIGKVYELTGAHEKALGNYSKSIELNPQYVRALMNRGNLYMSREMYSLALEDFKNILKINPQNKEALQSLVRIENIQKRNSKHETP